MSEDNDVQESGRGSKERSPNYPSIPLTQAVELAQKMYDREKRTPVSQESAVRAFGYNSLSGKARTILASLRQYGLVENVKDGVRISDLAMEVIHNPIGSAERTKALKDAAMRPSLIVELEASHADASDDTLKAYLITKRKFSPEGAGRFVPAFREAIQIARLPDLTSVDPKASGGKEIPYPPAPKERLGWVGTAKTLFAPHEGGEDMEFVWHLSGDVVATMSVSRKIEEDDVDTLLDNLRAAEKAIRKQAKANAVKTLHAAGGAENAAETQG